MIKLKLSNIKWTVPFFAFILGYLTVKFIFSINKTIKVPTVIGLQFKDAAKILSENNLNIRIIEEKEDDDLPDGTIITQSPYDSEIKPLQSIYLIISKKAKKKLAPDFRQKNINEINKIARKNGIKTKSYYLPNNQKTALCIAQMPEANEPLEDNRMIIYISNGNNKKIIFPDLRGLELDNALEFLDLYSIKPTILESDFKKEKIIKEQRPLPGSILDLEKIKVQLKV